MSLRRPNGFISAGYDPLEVPNAPTIGTASVASATSVSVTFTAPANVGGSAITGYVATAKKTSDGTTISGTGSSSPVTISGLTTGDAYTVTVAAVNSFGLGVSSAASNSVTPLESQLWSWGNNDHGQLGLGDTYNRSSPVQVGSLTSWVNIATGVNFTFANRNNGTLWSWGRNNYGELVQGDTTSRSSPTQIGSSTLWSQIAAGANFALATRTNGTLWAWGRNNNGQLGLGFQFYGPSNPNQVGALTNWSQVAAGQSFSVAVKTDGTLWSWGLNDVGQLGLGYSYIGGYLQSRSSPVQVGGLTNWSQVAAGAAFAVAVKTDGTLWAWGRNANGQLGLGVAGAYNDRSSPVQVGLLSNWSQVACLGFATVARKTDQTIWAWGYNTSGQLGLNDTAGRSSPVQIGSLTTWSQISANGYTTFAITNSGGLWIWGSNTSGALGQNDTANRSSPVQVGSLTTWQRLSKGSRSTSTLAIKG